MGRRSNIGPTARREDDKPPGAVPGSVAHRVPCPTARRRAGRSSTRPWPRTARQRASRPTSELELSHRRGEKLFLALHVGHSGARRGMILLSYLPPQEASPELQSRHSHACATGERIKNQFSFIREVTHDLPH